MSRDLTALLARVATEQPRFAGLPRVGDHTLRKLDRQRSRLARMNALVAKHRSAA